MQEDTTPKSERRETVGELLELIFVVQTMGHRLAYETHGEAYDLVWDLNGLLHQARDKIERIQIAAKSLP
ncbi:MAG: hypothetical protein M0P39_12565 [Rhodocyclaceae bacterium]|nr:hypothetical protein [Rhodocyclaceae bacterium]